MNQPDGPGRDVALKAVAEAHAVLEGRVRAAYVLGSLAHGGFSPHVSDVDLALVLDRIEPGTASAIARISDAVRGSFAQTAHRRLAERLSIFWSDEQALTLNREAGRFPAPDRLDLIDSGRLLSGEDLRSRFARPGKDDLVVDSAGFSVRRFGAEHYLRMLADPRALVNQGPRPVTKTVLFPVRLRYTAATGLLGRNDDAATWYLSERHVGGELVAAAMRWRGGEPMNAEHAVALLDSDLVAMYVEFVDDLGAHVACLPRPDLGEELRALRVALPEA